MFISNSSTVILLAKISLLRKFLDIYDEIMLPTRVYEEIMIKKDQLDALFIQKEIERERIVVRDVKNNEMEQVMKQFRLDVGEASAYFLFKMMNAKAILTDDGQLIKLCKVFEIPFITAMAVVVRMFEKGKLKKDAACKYLEKLNGYGRYADEIYSYYRAMVGCP